MKNLERAFSFIFHIFRAAENVRPRDEYWVLYSYPVGYYHNKRYANQREIKAASKLLANLPKNGREKLN